MDQEILVSEIVASLVRRGFASGLVERHEDLVTQVLAVDEELGEVARLARRIRQLVDVEDAARNLASNEIGLIAAWPAKPAGLTWGGLSRPSWRRMNSAVSCTGAGH